ncbi:hypothetical protein IFM89_010081 [Coptis chinensis]|uniref:Pentatricopeptide repeat-containing protein n=1 Tax=Coptis chinensis TaxID=261450 RepID=A0A835HZK5_9MAGN|nr:hypothetical protein IFM89_010081 [Coptis chinensis]
MKANVLINGICKDEKGIRKKLFHIRCLDQKNDTHKAMQLLNILLDKGFSPDAKTSSLLVDLFVEGGPNSKEMEMLLKRLPKGCAKENVYMQVQVPKRKLLTRDV